MKKIIIISLIALLLTGCSQSEENKAIIADQELQIESLNAQIETLEQQKAELDSIVIEEKEEKGVANYIVTLEIKQSHAFWDLEGNIKDEMNAIEIEIPVTKEYYDGVDIGTTINDDFRVGSLIMSSSIGSWDITISDKEIR